VSGSAQVLPEAEGHTDLQKALTPWVEASAPIAPMQAVAILSELAVAQK
jgi:hypothetical protein